VTILSADSKPSDARDVRLGLGENWPQFSLLVLVNAFVGGMVGLERTVVPLIGSQEFKIASTTIVVSFIVSFGVVKAVANLVSGQFADLVRKSTPLVGGRGESRVGRCEIGRRIRTATGSHTPSRKEHRRGGLRQTVWPPGRSGARA
jgi:hypothetical protein